MNVEAKRECSIFNAQNKRKKKRLDYFDQLTS